MKTKSLFSLILGLLTAVMFMAVMLGSTPPATADLPFETFSVTFQQGFNGYTGTRDMTVTGNWGGELSKGASPQFDFGGVPWGGVMAPCFIAFDDIFGASGIPAGTPADDIVSATLEVFIFKSGTVDGYAQIYAMHTPWFEGDTVGWGQVEGTSKYHYRRWREDGVYGPDDYWGDQQQSENGPVSGIDFNVDADLELRHLKTFQIIDPEVDPGYWLDFDVTASVKAWADGIIDNNGWYGYSSGYWTHPEAYSSDYTDDPTLRPKLTVVFIPEPGSLLLLAAGSLLALMRRRR